MAYKSLIPFYISYFKLKFEGGLLLNIIYIYILVFTVVCFLLIISLHYTYLYEVLCYQLFQICIH